MTHQRWPSRGGGMGCGVTLLVLVVWLLLRRPQAGIAKLSPLASIAQAMRAFFAAIATTAFQ